MSPQQQEYFVIVDVLDSPQGIVVYGHAPRTDTPWPKAGEVVEVLSLDGKRIQMPIAGIDKDYAEIPGAHPFMRVVMIAHRSAPSGSLLVGFRVRSLRGNPVR